MITRKSGVYFFPIFLGSIVVLFIGIMLFVYQGAKEANPVILDEKGRPRDAATTPSRP